MQLIEAKTGNKVGVITENSIVLARDFTTTETIELAIMPDSLNAAAMLLESNDWDITTAQTHYAGTGADTSPFTLDCMTTTRTDYGVCVAARPIPVAIINLTPVRFDITITDAGRKVADGCDQRQYTVILKEDGSKQCPNGFGVLFARMLVIMRVWGFDTEKLLFEDS